MNDELRTDFTHAERETIIAGLRDEYGDHEFSDELILLECQDMWRKGCHHLDNGTKCHNCGSNGECNLIGWEKRHPEYKDDVLVKRLKELRDEVAEIHRNEIMDRLVMKGYVKVQTKQWKDGKLTESRALLYLPGEDKLKLAVVDAIANWKNMWGCYFDLAKIDLNAKSGIILELRVEQDDEYEIWEII